MVKSTTVSITVQAAAPTGITLTPSATSIPAGQMLSLKVAVTDQAGRPMAGVNVYIYQVDPYTRTAKLGPYTTGSDGTYTWQNILNIVGNWQFTAGTDSLRSNVVTVSVTSPTQGGLTISASPTTIVQGQSTTITGKLTGPTGIEIQAATVYLNYIDPTGVTKTGASSTTTDTTGNYSFTVTLNTVGTWQFWTSTNPDGT